MMHKVKLDNGTEVELRLTDKQEYIIEHLPKTTKQKLFKLVIEKSMEQAERSSKETPEKLLSKAARGNFEDIGDSFADLFDDFFKNFKCPHCGKGIKK